jgi:hypothetical protein
MATWWAWIYDWVLACPLHWDKVLLLILNPRDFRALIFFCLPSFLHHMWLCNVQCSWSPWFEYWCYGYRKIQILWLYQIQYLLALKSDNVFFTSLFLIVCFAKFRFYGYRKFSICLLWSLIMSISVLCSWLFVLPLWLKRRGTENYNSFFCVICCTSDCFNLGGLIPFISEKMLVRMRALCPYIQIMHGVCLMISAALHAATRLGWCCWCLMKHTLVCGFCSGQVHTSVRCFLPWLVCIFLILLVYDLAGTTLLRLDCC